MNSQSKILLHETLYFKQHDYKVFGDYHPYFTGYDGVQNVLQGRQRRQSRSHSKGEKMTPQQEYAAYQLLHQKYGGQPILPPSVQQPILNTQQSGVQKHKKKKKPVVRKSDGSLLLWIGGMVILVLALRFLYIEFTTPNTPTQKVVYRKTK
jgi:hypothetical protein